MSIEANGKIYAFFYHEEDESYEAYESYNIHFHVPSEHTINGVSYPAEAHVKLAPTTYDMLPAEALGDYAGYDFSNSTEANHFHAVVGFLF